MKSLLLIFALPVFSFHSFAQTLKISEIPVEVQTAFKVLFPKAEEVSWSMEKQSVYEAEFELNEIECSANFNVDGRWMETEKEIQKKDIPPAVLTNLKTEFKGFRIKSCEEITSPDEVIYEFTLRKLFQKKEVKMHPDGRLIHD